MEIFDARTEQPQSPAPNGKGRFPYKMALTIVVVTAALALWNFYVDHGKGFDLHTITETFRLRKPAPPAPLVPGVSHPEQVLTNGQLPPPPPDFVDDSNALDSFFASLWDIEQGKAGSPVTALHYGDSPTTADLITGDIRTQLQQRFGDAGRGYTLIAKPWAWYGHRGVDMSDHGWKIRTGVGLWHEGIYGLGGATFEGQPGAWSKFTLTESEQSAAEIEYLAQPGGGSFVVEAGDQQIAEQSTGADSQHVAFLHVALPAGTKIVTLRPSSGTVTLTGIDFRRGQSGLLYDSLGLNGVTTTFLARVIEPNLWKEELERAKPSLIIVNYGSNESSFGNYVQKQYADELRMTIQRIRTAAPGVPILIMSPMDRGERSGMNDIETMSTIPDIVAIQRKVAAENNCAFFDTYDAMGGNGTIARWYAASPRLVTADLLHPTPQGATIVAGLFVEQLGLRYDRWKMQHGIAVTPQPAPAPPKKTDGTKAATTKPKTTENPRQVRRRNNH